MSLVMFPSWVQVTLTLRQLSASWKASAFPLETIQHATITNCSWYSKPSAKSHSNATHASMHSQMSSHQLYWHTVLIMSSSDSAPSDWLQSDSFVSSRSPLHICPQAWCSYHLSPGGRVSHVSRMVLFCCVGLRGKHWRTGWQDWKRCLHIRKWLLWKLGHVHTQVCGSGYTCHSMGNVMAFWLLSSMQFESFSMKAALITVLGFPSWH